MSAEGPEKHRSRPTAGGVRLRRGRPVGLRPALIFVLAAGLGGPAAAVAQVPADTVPPDTLASDTLPADTLPGDTVPATDTLPPDTTPGVEALPDTLSGDTIPGDTLALPGDTLPADSIPADTVVAADTIQLEHLPEPSPATPAGWETGVWTWNREELLSSRATTLGELLGQVPGVIELRGGDFGMPRSVTAFGAGGGGVRVFRDGVEVLPLEGSVVDLTRAGLAGVDEVRVERTGSGIRVELHSLRVEDPRPYSLVEAGTGDLDTNLLRGVFFHPRALGGNAGLALERQDTRGPRREEPGAATTVWLHYAYLVDESFGVAADLSRSTASRDTLFVPNQVTRTDWRVRGRWRPLDGLVADLFWSRATLDADSTDGGVQPFPFRSEARSQWGARIGAEYGPLSGRLTYRDPTGDGLAERRLSGELVGRLPDLGGAAATWRRASWSARSTSTLGLRAWTEPLWGLSAFGSWEDFEHGVPALPPPPPEENGEDGGDGTEGAAAVGFRSRGVTGVPSSGVGFLQDTGGEPAQNLSAEPRFTEGRYLRVGGRFRWRGLELSGARLDLERDSVHPLALPMDRTGPSFAAGERRGWEVAFRIPLLLVDGLALEGSGQLWDEVADPWPYFPRRTWHGALSLHETYFPTGNLEVWFDLGVQGRDRMAVALPGSAEPEPPDGGGGTGTGAVAGRPSDRASVTAGTPGVRGPGARPGPATAALQAPNPAEVPFYQSFYVRLQIRVVTVRIFASWENFTLRDVNQDFPGRILPQTRAVYGVRWTLWN